jgi:multidrug resistance protein MdtO
MFFTAADWQGIHTIMLSCVIVAQPGLGATLQKTWLRIGGALLATLIALILIVFVQPWTDSLSGLLAMTLPVFALAAWIAAGSERIAYAGIQIGFTFALAFLSWFGPLSNLTELRDRVIGILLGVLVSSLFISIYGRIVKRRSSKRGWRSSIGNWRKPSLPATMKCNWYHSLLR